jgi:quercetin dioxygenase-like cupin family protein
MSDQALAQLPLVIASSDTGKTISLGRTLHNFKLNSADTSGKLALMEATMQPHTLTIPHMHTNEDEILIPLEGELGIRIGDDEFHVGPGAYIFAPHGILHALWNRTDTVSKGISIFSPAGIEPFFEELSAVLQASFPPDVAKLNAINQKYGITSFMDWVPELSAKYGVKMG